MGFHRRSKKPVGRKTHRHIDIDYCYGNTGTTWYGGMRPRFGPTLFLALTMNSKDPSGKGPKETWVEQDSHDCNIKIQLTPRNPGPSMPVLAMGLHFTYNSHEAMWQLLWLRPPRCFPSHDRPHPMPPSFYRLPRHEARMRQRERWSDVTHRCAWTLNSYSMRSADAHAILHIHSMSIQHLSTGLTPDSAE